MSGSLINPPAPPDQRGTMSDPILMAAQQKLEAGLAPDNRQNYMKIVVAGLAGAITGGPKGLLASLKGSPDPVRDAARGAVALVLLLRRQAKGVMPLKAMVPAAFDLMLHGLDFVNRTGMAKVGTPELVRATHIFTNEIFQAFHISPQMLQGAAAKVHQITQDPVAMDFIGRKGGWLVAPGASRVADIPGVQG